MYLKISDNDIAEKIHDIEVNIKNKPDRASNKKDYEDINQMSLFDTVTDKDIIDDLLSLDLTNMTPLDALNNLSRLQSKLNNRW